MGMGYLGHCCLFRRLHLLLQNTPIHCWINQFVSLTSWLSSSASSPQNWNVVQIVSLPPSLSLVFARAVAKSFYYFFNFLHFRICWFMIPRSELVPEMPCLIPTSADASKCLQSFKTKKTKLKKVCSNFCWFLLAFIFIFLHSTEILKRSKKRKKKWIIKCSF